jgi:acylphosphatase
MIVRAGIVVTGTVQGVYYRYSTTRIADGLGLKGTVRNLPDGGVEIVCEGEEKDVKSLIEWCKKGPRGAYVTRVDVEWEAPTHAFPDFSIVY